jgi:catechol 2,3-dioxygenase-like lactoylglutathione lyase family enzyme
MKLVELAFFTDDVSEMTAFYQRLLGTEAVAQSEDMAIFMVGHTKIFIHKNYTPGEGDLPPDNHMAFEVKDLDAACAELAARGLEIEVPPTDYYWGRSAYLRDPDGQMVEVCQGEEG